MQYPDTELVGSPAFTKAAAQIPKEGLTIAPSPGFRRRTLGFAMSALLILLTFPLAVAQTADSTAPAGTGAPGTYTPGAGFKVAKSDLGELSISVFSYVRYLNQMGLDSTYTDAFGNVRVLDRRQDVELNKVVVYFRGWVMDPKFRYVFYVWTSNTSMGLGAQVVVAGNLTYAFNKHFSLAGGVDGLPGVRSTEGNFPLWLPVDNRSIADEFFRPSYTMGFWVAGKIVDRVNYKAMIGNNLSQLGIDASELDNQFNTVSAALAWYPTTGEYGRRSQFGDFDQHEQVATRLAGHFTRSPEHRQGQPNTDAFDNVQIRLSDGSVIFAPNLFGAGVRIDNATYHMYCFDAGVKYRGFSLDGEFYRRWVNSFDGPGTSSLAFDELVDHGFQLLTSAMAVPQTVQLYAMYSKVFGEYGDPWDLRGGVSVYPLRNQVLRCNAEFMHVYRSPVGALSLPYAVGATGNIFYLNFQVEI